MDKKVLVVDSDYFFVEFLTELLNKRGYEVLKAYNGKEGIALLEDMAVDIVFADLVLPKVDYTPKAQPTCLEPHLETAVARDRLRTFVPTTS